MRFIMGAMTLCTLPLFWLAGLLFGYDMSIREWFKAWDEYRKSGESWGMFD